MEPGSGSRAEKKKWTRLTEKKMSNPSPRKKTSFLGE
jgi:hypothetical protein